VPAPPPNFGTLGWAPEGDVFYVYEIATDVPFGSGAAAIEFHAAAASDIDGDTINNEWAYVKPAAGTVVYGGAAPGNVTSCVPTGVFDPVTNATILIATVGPCATGMGQSIF
jgi:hypothetical protein